MLTLLAPTLMVTAEEAAEHGAEVDPYLIGGVALVIQLVLLFILLAFGKGREHT